MEVFKGSPYQAGLFFYPLSYLILKTFNIRQTKYANFTINYSSLMKKIIWLLGGALIICAGMLAWRLSYPEVAWLCQDGQWIKHGQPAQSKPSQGCGLEAATSPQDLASAYIRGHIAELSPEPSVLGGNFFVTDISFPQSNRAIVSYEDGHIALAADVNYRVTDGQVVITSFTETSGPLVQTAASLLASKYQQPAGSYRIGLQKSTGDFARGTVNFPEGGGGVWFAARTDQGWQLAYDGNGIIPCGAASQYNFPKDLIPQCLDAEHGNNVIAR